MHWNSRSLLTPLVVIIPKHDQQAKPITTKDPHAPKRPRGRPPKDASGQPGAHHATSESSEDELEIEDEDPPEMTPALLTVSMPTDERGKALYRAVQAVWSPRNKSVDPEKIRTGIANFGDTIRGLRDAWKTRNESLRKAELPNSPTAADAFRLKEEVARYRQNLELVMLKSLQYGHLAIVKRYVVPDLPVPTSFCSVPGSVFREMDTCDQNIQASPYLSRSSFCLNIRASSRLISMGKGPVCTSLSYKPYVHSFTLLDSLRSACSRDPLGTPIGRSKHLSRACQLISLADNIVQTR